MTVEVKKTAKVLSESADRETFLFIRANVDSYCLLSL